MNANSETEALTPPTLLLTYFPQIDGLRTLALGLVLLNHWGGFAYTGHWWIDCFLAPIRIGWIGVDLFFVISGFLITGILIDTRTAPHHFRDFYIRRALRIVPVYYLVLIVITVILPAIPYVQNLPTWHSSVHGNFWHYLFLTNFSEGMGYTNSRLTVPYWSLAVEEHFYLIWPLFVYRYPRLVAKLCIWGIVLSCCMRILPLHILGGSDRLVGFFTPGRVDGLLGGSLVAVLARRGPEMICKMVHWARIIAPATVIAIPICLYMQEMQGRYRLYPGSSQHPWVVSIGLLYFAAFFTSLLVLTVFGNFGNRVTLARPIRAFGKITYCGYLIHEPVHIIVAGSAIALGYVGKELSWQWLVVNLIAFSVMLFLCILSWEFFEKPILRLKKFFPRTGGEIQGKVNAGNASPDGDWCDPIENASPGR